MALNDDVRFRVGADTRSLDNAMRNTRRAVDRDVNGVRRSFQGLDRGVGASLANSTRSVVGLGRAVAGLAVAFGAIRLTGAIREATTYAAGIRDAANRTGVFSETLQELRFAAEQSGNSIEDMDRGLEILGRRLGEAANGTGELLPLLERYGISITDAEGRTRSVEAVLGDIADAMANAGSAAERLDIANKAFGRSGAGLINTLMGGSDALAEQAEKARELGAVMDDDLVQKGGEADDRLAALGRTLDTQVKEILIELVPIIETIGGLLVWLAERAGEAIGIIGAAVSEVRLLIGAIEEIAADSLRLRIGASREDMVDPAALRAALEDAQRQLEEQQDRIPHLISQGILTEEDAAAGIEEITRTIADLEQAIVDAETAIANAPRIVEPFASEMIGATRQELEAMNAELARMIAMQRESAAAGGPGIASRRDDGTVVPQDLANLIATQAAVQSMIDALPSGSAGGGGGGGRAAVVREETDAVADLIATMQRRLDLLGIEERTLGMTEQAATAYTLAQEALLELMHQGVEVTPRQRAEIEALAESFAAGEQRIRDFAAAEEEAARRAEALDGLLEDVGQTAANSAATAIESWDGVGNAVRSLIADLLRLQSVQAAVANIFGDVFDGGSFNWGGLFGGGGGSGSGGGGFFDGSGVPGSLTPSFPGRADGGGVRAGEPVVVGERRMPEIFVPDTAGRVVPVAPGAAGGMGGGGNVYEFNVGPGTDRAALAELKALIVQLAGPGRVEERAKGAVLNDRRRNPARWR